jgi:hypothetical protein
MDHIQILKRAWAIAWRYRALWLVGLILAVTTVSWEGTTVYSWRDEWDDDQISTVDIHLPNRSIIRVPGHIRIRDDETVGRVILNHRHSRDDWRRRPGDLIVHWNPPQEYALEVVGRDGRGQLMTRRMTVAPHTLNALLMLGIVLAGVLFVILLLSRVARYVSEAALLRMVDDYESTGARYGFWQGLKLGWSRSAWRIFLINWCIGAPAALAFTLLFVPVLVPMALWFTHSEAARVFGVLSTFGLFLVALAVILVASSVLSVWKRFAWRACTLDDLGALKSIGRGLSMIRQHVRDVGVMWLLMVGLEVISPFLIAPFVLVLLPVAGFAAGGFALAVGGLALSVWQGAGPWVAAAVVGVALFLSLFLLPLQLLGGILEAFRSSAWTLTYRQLRGVERAVAAPIAQLAPSSAD